MAVGVLDPPESPLLDQYWNGRGRVASSQPSAMPAAPEAKPDAPPTKPLDPTADVTKIADRTSQKVEGLEKESAALRPPQLMMPQKPMAKPDESAKMWGALAIAFAALASLKSRTPMTTALNAAGAAITAMKQGEKDRADQAYKTWEQDSKTALEIYHAQADAYKTALEGVHQREELAIQTGDREERAAMAKINALAAAAQDPQMTQALQQGGLAAATELQKTRETQAKKLEQQRLEMQSGYLQWSALQSLKATPEYQNADPMAKTEMQLKVIERTNPKMFGQMSSRPLPDQVVDKLADKIGNYEMAPPTGVLLRTEAGRQQLVKTLEKYPDYNPSDYPLVQAAKKALLGADGNAVKSLSVLQQHLEYFQKLADALPEQADMQTANAIVAKVSREAGYPQVTNFETAKQIVGDEAVKAILGTGAGALADREALKEAISTANSPAQLRGFVDTMKHLVQGQIVGLVNKYSKYVKPEDMLPASTMAFYGFKPSTYHPDKSAIFGAPLAPETPSADAVPAQGGNADLLAQAKDAIAKGAPRDKVVERLKEKGIDPSALGP